MDNKEYNIDLTVIEISNIWSAYMKDSMEAKFYEYFNDIVEDNRAKEIINIMLKNSKESLLRLEKAFKAEGLAVPNGFTDEDVKIEIPRIISDAFIMSFCYDFTLLTIDTYSSALLSSTRRDIRQYFQEFINNNIIVQNELIEAMLSRGIYTKYPQLAIDRDVKIIGNKKYLGGILGKERPLNVSEIANLTRIIYRAQFSKMAFTLFSKTAKSKKLKEHFKNGGQEIQKVIDSLRSELSKENIPISSTEDYKIFDSEASPFSDKLMLFFVNTCLGIYCFKMISQAMTSSMRVDIVSKIQKIVMDLMTYYDEGIKIMIKNEWFEAPPQPIDRSI